MKETRTMGFTNPFHDRQRLSLGKPLNNGWFYIIISLSSCTTLWSACMEGISSVSFFTFVPFSTWCFYRLHCYHVSSLPFCPTNVGRNGKKLPETSVQSQLSSKQEGATTTTTKNESLPDISMMFVYNK